MSPGDVYTNLETLLSINPSFKPLHKLYIQAGLEGEVKNMQGDSNTLTIFAPTGGCAKPRATLPHCSRCLPLVEASRLLACGTSSGTCVRHS